MRVCPAVHVPTGQAAAADGMPVHWCSMHYSVSEDFSKPLSGSLHLMGRELYDEYATVLAHSYNHWGLQILQSGGALVTPPVAQSHSCLVVDWRHSAVLTGILLLWPQPCLPPHPAMSEKTQQGKLATAKKKLKQLWQRKSPGIPGGKQINSSSPDASTSCGYHSPGDSATGVYREGPASSTLKDLESQHQQLEVALDSSSTIIGQLSENINSLGRAPRMLKEWKQQLQKLGRSLFKLKHQTAEPLAPEPPAGPSEVEQLQAETNHLRKELESMGRRLQAEVENNKMLILLNTRHNERLRRAEKRIREREESIHEWEERIYEWDLHIWEQEERLCEWEERLQEREERLHQRKKLPRQERPRELERMLEPGWEAFDEEWDEPSSASEDLNKTLQLVEQKVKEKKPGGAEEPRGSESAAAARPLPVYRSGSPNPTGAGVLLTSRVDSPGLGGEAVGTGEAAGGAGEAACHSFRAAKNGKRHLLQELDGMDLSDPISWHVERKQRENRREKSERIAGWELDTLPWQHDSDCTTGSGEASSPREDRERKAIQGRGTMRKWGMAAARVPHSVRGPETCQDGRWIDAGTKSSLGRETSDLLLVSQKMLALRGMSSTRCLVSSGL
ncbi:golgin subfamily A member 6-like protein 9 [Nomascus leucogenys]|uniref:golgin subfamily A member 6-like protein 9 n=1 Tax=Nomascus leucogenys TaxID=61853 RepID=UPI00122DA2B2|nr:golgin subfamily A member 6-like protein 9 [Nomascus leucogenys]